MYALFAICNCLSPSKLDEQILSNAKERYADQIAKMTSPFTLTNRTAASETPGSPTNNAKAASSPASEALAAYSELFLFACPKFITANAPPYGDSTLLTEYVLSPPEEPASRHLVLFLDDVKARKEVPTLRSYLKLYTSLDASKLAGFLERDEEELVQLMMVMKMNSRSISRLGNEGTLLDGQVITTSDLDFVINEVRRLLFSDFCVTEFAGRIWFTLWSQSSTENTEDGLFETQNTLRGCMMRSKQVHSQLQSLLQLWLQVLRDKPRPLLRKQNHDLLTHHGAVLRQEK